MSYAAVSNGHIYIFHNCIVVVLTKDSSANGVKLIDILHLNRCKVSENVVSNHFLALSLRYLIVSFNSSLQSTSATIYHHVQLRLLSFFAHCTKFNRTYTGSFVSSFIHWRRFSTNHARNFDTPPSPPPPLPDFVSFIWAKTRLGWKKRFTSEN